MSDKQATQQQPQPQAQELATVTTPGGCNLMLAVPEATIAALDDLSKQGVLANSMTSQFKRIFITGAVMYNMEQILTPQVMKNIMWLQNSPIGFMTDKPQGGYDEQTVRQCVIQASMMGIDIIGNEFNILAGRFYTAKNGLKHMLRRIPGLMQNVTPGIPKMTAESTAIITMHLDWTYNGKHKEKDLTLPIRVNKGMGADAIIGKGTRKAYAWLYEEVTGNSAMDGEVEDMIAITPDTAPSSPLEQAPAPNLLAADARSQEAQPVQMDM